MHRTGFFVQWSFQYWQCSGHCSYHNCMFSPHAMVEDRAPHHNNDKAIRLQSCLCTQALPRMSHHVLLWLPDLQRWSRNHKKIPSVQSSVDHLWETKSRSPWSVGNNTACTKRVQSELRRKMRETRRTLRTWSSEDDLKALRRSSTHFGLRGLNIMKWACSWRSDSKPDT